MNKEKIDNMKNIENGIAVYMEHIDGASVFTIPKGYSNAFVGLSAEESIEKECLNNLPQFIIKEAISNPNVAIKISLFEYAPYKSALEYRSIKTKEIIRLECDNRILKKGLVNLDLYVLKMSHIPYVVYALTKEELSEFMKTEDIKIYS